MAVLTVQKQWNDDNQMYIHDSLFMKPQSQLYKWWQNAAPFTLFNNKARQLKVPTNWRTLCSAEQVGGDLQHISIEK